MSTTLTNGLKLPDKGSVDWYADMQNNYTILDGAVGTIADHTTAIAGKAPSLHTHTKSDVTDLLNSNFIPSANNSYDLGSSSYQWNNLYAKKVNTQSVNGINPGALSLPNIEASTNLAGDITDFTGATQLSLNSGSIGWVYIQIPNVQGDYIEVQIGNSASIRYFVSAGYSDSLDSIEVLVPKPPVVTKVRVKATGGAVSKALFYPCLGNV